MTNSSIILPSIISSPQGLLATPQGFAANPDMGAANDNSDELIPDIIWVTAKSVDVFLRPLKLDPITGYLPFLKRREENSSKIEQYNDYFSLLVGILYTWEQTIPSIAGQIVPKIDREIILERLQQGFELDTTENLILSAAAKLRIDFSHYQSMRILNNGLVLQPESSKLRSDLIMDSAVVLSGQPTNSELARLVVASMEEIDLSQVEYYPRQVMLLSALSAKIVLEESQFQLVGFSKKHQNEIDIFELKQIWKKLLADYQTLNNPFYWVSETILAAIS